MSISLRYMLIHIHPVITLYFYWCVALFLYDSVCVSVCGCRDDTGRV